MIARDIHRGAGGTNGGDFSSEAIIASRELPMFMHPPQQAETLALPGGHHDKRSPRLNGNQPPGEQFIEVSGEQWNIDTKESNQDQRNKILIPVPVLDVPRVMRGYDVSTMVPVTAIPYAAARYWSAQS
ncbi:hypothetical protein ACLK1S_23220 [Escherichia coli]